MENKFRTIINNTVIGLKDKDYVNGILLFGSCARGIELDHNDIDFYVLINKNWYQRKSSYCNGVLVELFFNPYKRYIYYFENEENLFTAQMFATGKILFDKSGEMKKLQKAAKKISQKLAMNREAVDMIKYHIAEANIDIERELKIDKYQALYLMNNAIEALLKYYFRIRKSPEPKCNYIVKKVKTTNRKLYTKLGRFFRETNINLKFNILKNIEKSVLEPIGKPKLTWTSPRKMFFPEDAVGQKK